MNFERKLQERISKLDQQQSDEQRFVGQKVLINSHESGPHGGIEPHRGELISVEKGEKEVHWEKEPKMVETIWYTIKTEDGKEIKKASLTSWIEGVEGEDYESPYKP